MINNQTVKSWALMLDTFNEDDYTWIMGINPLKITVDRPTHTFDTASGGRHTIAGKPTIEIFTTTEEQESMLLLKYSNQLILKSVVCIQSAEPLCY